MREREKKVTFSPHFSSSPQVRRKPCVLRPQWQPLCQSEHQVIKPPLPSPPLIRALPPCSLATNLILIFPVSLTPSETCCWRKLNRASLEKNDSTTYVGE